MKKLWKILALGLSVVMLSSLAACSGGGESVDSEYKSLNEIKSQLTEKVDYTTSTEQFDFYTYKSLSNGTYKKGNTTYNVGESFITDEKIIEYFESGMSFISPQTMAQVNKSANSTTPFAETKAGKFLDQVARLGYKNSVVLTDYQLYMPYNGAKGSYDFEYYKDQYNKGLMTAQDWEDLCDSISVINPNSNRATWQYETVEDFEAWVEDNMRQYYFHEAFQGIFLPDEPAGLYLNVVGETYQAVRKVEKKLKAEKAQMLGVNVEDIEDMYVNLNLFPFWGASTYFFPVEASFGNLEQRNCEAYKRYIEKYFETTKADFVQADIYPLGNESITQYYFANVEIMAEVAAENNAKIIVVTQSNNDANHRIATEESLRYINNLAFGFGAENIGYYAYYTLDDGGGAYGLGYVYDDNGCLMNRFGDKTPVYDLVKNANAEAQALAPVIKNFNYTTSKRFNGQNSNTKFDDAYLFYGENINGLEFAEFSKLAKAEFDKEAAVVTELYDANKENYMYMVMNVTDPLNKGSLYYQTATVTFATEYNKVLGFFNGGYKVFDLDENNSLSVKMRPGEAHYLIPFAA